MAEVILRILEKGVSKNIAVENKSRMILIANYNLASGQFAATSFLILSLVVK